MVLSILSGPITHCDFPPNLPNLFTQSLLCPHLFYNQTLPSFGPTVYLSLCMNSWLPASVPLPQSTPYSYTNNAQQDLTMKLDQSHNNPNSPCCLPANLPSDHSPSGSRHCLKSPVRRHGLHPAQHSPFTPSQPAHSIPSGHTALSRSLLGTWLRPEQQWLG